LLFKLRKEYKMTIMSVREVSPLPGRAQEAQSRVHEGVEIMRSHGANAWATKVIVGDRVSDFDIYAAYPNFSAGAKAFQAFSNDPNMIKLMSKAQSDQAANMNGPWIGRLTYGSPASTPTPISVHRDYRMPRSNMASVMALCPQLDKLMSSHNVSLAVGNVIHGSDHEMMRVIYRFKSLDHWGETLDKMVTNDEFVSLVMKADELGTLEKSRVLQNL